MHSSARLRPTPLLVAIVLTSAAVLLSLMLSSWNRAAASYTPNDPRFAEQWNLQRIRMPEAWDIASQSPSVRVALVSSGATYSHPELSASLEPGFNAIRPGDTLDDRDGMGTLSAGVIAAATNNASGVAGISWGVQIVPVKTCEWGFCQELDLIEGILWAADPNGGAAQIIEVDAGQAYPSPALQAAVEYAASQGAVIVAAAGKRNDYGPGYPAAYTTTHANVISVGAIDNADRISSMTASGPDVVAPGVSVLTTSPSGIAVNSGNGIAAAHVSGVLALLWERGITGPAGIAAVQGGARNLGADTGWDAVFGHGALDACAALSEAGLICPLAAEPTPDPTETNTATPTRTNTPVPPSPTRTSTPPAATATPTQTNTFVAPGMSPTPTGTAVAASASPTDTSTPVPPSATPTRTSTAVPPSATPTRTSTPVPPSATPTRTSTPVPPSATPTRTWTPVPPNSPTATPTANCPPGKKKNRRC